MESFHRLINWPSAPTAPPAFPALPVASFQITYFPAISFLALALTTLCSVITASSAEQQTCGDIDRIRRQARECTRRLSCPARPHHSVQTSVSALAANSLSWFWFCLFSHYLYLRNPVTKWRTKLPTSRPSSRWWLRRTRSTLTVSQNTSLGARQRVALSGNDALTMLFQTLRRRCSTVSRPELRFWAQDIGEERARSSAFLVWCRPHPSALASGRHAPVVIAGVVRGRLRRTNGRAV